MPKEYYNAVGATLSPIGATLKQLGTNGRLAATNLTGKTVKVEVRNAQGNVVVAETTTGVTVTGLTTGDVAYAIPAALAAGGEFFLYFHVYGAGGESSKYDVFPIPQPEENRMRIVIAPKV
jgi:hypothetical protein